MGRPTEYTNEIAKIICDRIANGESLTSICKDEAMSAKGTVLGWVQEDREGFKSRYQLARQIQADCLFDEIIDIADGSGLDVEVVDGRVLVSGEAIARARLRVDTRKWAASKLLPKVYGERIAHEIDLNKLSTEKLLDILRYEMKG